MIKTSTEILRKSEGVDKIDAFRRNQDFDEFIQL